MITKQCSKSFRAFIKCSWWGRYCTFATLFWWFWCKLSCWLIIIEKFGPGNQQKWSYWPLEFFNFFSLVIKTLAAHLICCWKPDSLALFIDLLIFQRCKYFASILKILITHYLLRIHLDVLENFAKFIGTPVLKGSFFFNKLQAWGKQPYLKRDSDTGIFQWILWKFQEHLFYRKTSGRLLLHFHLNCCFQ